MNSSQEKDLGFLRTCIDRRFVTITRKAFEDVTGLNHSDYWHEAYAGGAAKLQPNSDGIDYAFNHGARIFGWQAHLNGCGGQPDVHDEMIIASLYQAATETALKYEGSKHFFILASDSNSGLEQIRKKVHQATEETTSKNLNAKHVLLFSINDNEILEELRQNFLQIDEVESSEYLEAGNVLIYAFQDDGEKLELFADDGSNLQELPEFNEIPAYQPESPALMLDIAS